MFTRKDFNHLSNYFLAHEAESRGYRVEKLYPETKLSHLVISHKGQTEVIIGQRPQGMSYNAYYICKHKHLTKKFLDGAGIRVPAGEKFAKKESAKALRYFDTIQKPVVIKPTDGLWGTAVCMNIATKKDARNAIQTVCGVKKSFMSGSFLIEEQIEGKEYRILATRNKLLGIIHRIPANVVGDGKSTIAQLIIKKNKDPRRGEKYERSLVKITVDPEMTRTLKDQGLTQRSVPEKGQQIFLRNNSNISAGGDSVDYTDKAHKKYAELAPKVIRAIPGLPYAGFDLITTDITKDPEKNGYAIIEINDSPMLSMHHEPFEGTPRNVSSAVIDMLFTKNS